MQLKARALDIQEQKIESNLETARMREEGQRMIAEAKLREDAQARAEFAYEKEKDRQSKLMTEGMRMEGDAQELAYKARTGKPGI